MDKCVKCNKQLLLRRKFYKYHGKKKGSFELTEGKVYCKKCYNSMYFLKEPNNEEFCELVIKIREKNIKKHCRKLKNILIKIEKQIGIIRGIY